MEKIFDLSLLQFWYVLLKKYLKLLLIADKRIRLDSLIDLYEATCRRILKEIVLETPGINSRTIFGRQIEKCYGEFSKRDVFY